ncbi:hypothetical protein ACIHCV_28885 [Streptomyces sp. NPDC051956]|uniref:hypothetical protein n=1 Tax=Streptomyces sp. NPDC051956 TaxID=3365677 RepID=UPI0037D93D78
MTDIIDSATGRAREQADTLARDLDAGRWTPSPLERTIAGLLVDAAAGDGALTAARIQAAFWEGSLSLVQDHGGRLASVLADLLPVTEDPGPDARAVLATAHDLLTRVAGGK